MPEQATPANKPASPAGKIQRPRRPASGQAVNLIIAIIIAILGYMWVSGSRLTDLRKDWQGVFLTNGQVYFGQVAKRNAVEVVVKDIYYLQVTRPLQQTQEGEQQANPQGELSLVKLGNELHGPTDTMFINRDHVLFIEDLKDDSNVVQAIMNYKSGQ